MRCAALLCAAALLGGCAMVPAGSGEAPAALLADTHFAPQSDAATDTSQLFALSPAMHEYLRSPRFREMVRIRGAQRALIDALYKAGELRLDYEGTATRTAAQTFELRSGNCLSLVIMTAALARELGVDITFQEVRVDQTWSRMGQLYVASSHVNVVLSTRTVSRFDGSHGSEILVVDFLAQEDAARQKSVRVPESTIVAMYANNRAAEALAANRVSDAYWWVRKALDTDPGLARAYNTLGAVYQRHGDDAMAERAFRAVLAREPDNTIAMENLAPVLEKLGKAAEATAMRRRLAALDPEPPFHYFRSGLEAMKRTDYKLARDMFQREVDRAPYSDQFHYWLGIAYLRLGEAGAAREQMALAMENSLPGGSRDSYALKLQRLKAMRGSDL